MDFAPSPRAQALAERVRLFVDEQVVPLEGQPSGEDGISPEQLADLRAKARAAPVVLPLHADHGAHGRRRHQAHRGLRRPRHVNCPGQKSVHGFLSVYRPAAACSYSDPPTTRPYEAPAAERLFLLCGWNLLLTPHI